jgi:hypothetical protein
MLWHSFSPAEFWMAAAIARQTEDPASLNHHVVEP